MRNYKLFLSDIVEAIHAIEKFIGRMSFEEFESDDKTASAVVKKLEIIGEAAKMIPESITNSYPNIPWTDMAGMRDRLVHILFWNGLCHYLGCCKR